MSGGSSDVGRAVPVVLGCVRFAQGGGLTDDERAARERVRLQAVERFERGQKNREISIALRVSEPPVER